MGKKDPRVDEYIASAADFAKPILRHLRAVVHKGCPDVVEEMKWSFPHFSYKGMFCGMAAFKEHATFGFWKQALLAERAKGMPKLGVEAMGQFGRITSLDDLPGELTLLALVKEAARLNDDGVKPRPLQVTPKESRVLKVPPYFMTVVRKYERP